MLANDSPESAALFIVAVRTAATSDALSAVDQYATSSMSPLKHRVVSAAPSVPVLVPKLMPAEVPAEVVLHVRGASLFRNMLTSMLPAVAPGATE